MITERYLESLETIQDLSEQVAQLDSAIAKSKQTVGDVNNVRNDANPTGPSQNSSPNITAIANHRDDRAQLEKEIILL